MFQPLLKRISDRSNLWLAITLAAWGSLILGLQGQAHHLSGITDPDSLRGFADGIRSAFPLLAGFSSLCLLAFLFRKKYPLNAGFLGPLGLMTVYGSVGLLAAFRSPDESLALYWSAVYLSVPLVLFAAMFGPLGTGAVTRIVQFNWIVLVALIGVFLVIALVKLNLADYLTDPASLLQCPLNTSRGDESWFSLTSGVLRSTGVGRYAALVAIIAVSMAWNRRSAPFWSFVLAVAALILLSSGARTAMVGFAISAPLVVALNWGRRGILIGTIILVSLITVVWGTGEHRTFIGQCLKLNIPQEPVPNDDSPTTATQVVTQVVTQVKTGQDLFPDDYYTLTGRTHVWKAGLTLVEDSPFLGYGFHADRLLLNNHMHNTYVHALLQAGTLGFIPLVAALGWAWINIIRLARRRNQIPQMHRQLIIQCAGFAAFFSARTWTESSGAFFGVDWLLMAPLLLYLQVMINTLLDSPAETT